MVTAYRFTNGSNPVKFVNITGNVSAGEINVAVEVLRGTSTLVNISPPGNIYKNINIWVGTSGFAVPRNIQKATVEFSVDRNWITENSITSINLLRYDTASKEWVSLPTNKVRENITEEYYQGETDRFSSFAITGGKSPSPAALSLAPVASPPAAEETPVVKSTQASESSNAPYWTLTLILFVVVVVLAVYIKLKRR
jgi:PGF-pre-PGF domain-containing protein